MRERARTAVVATLLVLLWGLYVVTGFRGVGFGAMWDEGQQLDGVRRSIETVSVAQTGYYYGGLYYVPGYSLVAPELLRRAPAMLEQMREAPSRPFDARRYPAIREAQRAALAVVNAPNFSERARRIFAGFASLSILGAFFASCMVTGSRWAALAAAAALATSWELSYHGRWIAVDSALAVFGSFVLCASCRALDADSSVSQRRMWFRIAALFAGCGLGCKMPGLFLLAPVLLGLWLARGEAGVRGFLKSGAEACGLVLLVFVITTPSVVLDPLHYANDMFRVQNDYNLIADDYPYCEPALGLRLAKIAGYWGLVAFSPQLWLALTFAYLILVGAITGLVERQPKLLVVLAFLFVYSAFIASQRLLTVRNLMVTLPALAVLLAAGVQRVAWRLSSIRGGGFALVAVLVIGVGLNARHSWRASGTVGKTTDDSILEQVEDEVLSQPHPKLYVSPALLQVLRQRASLPDSSLQSASWAEAETVLSYTDAMPGWKANFPRFARYFASGHANFDYYPGLLHWSGLKPAGHPIILLSKQRLLDLGVKAAPSR
jgi:hypothetical protein